MHPALCYGDGSHCWFSFDGSPLNQSHTMGEYYEWSQQVSSTRLVVYFALCGFATATIGDEVTSFMSCLNSFCSMSHSSNCLSLMESAFTSLETSCLPTKSMVSSLAILSSSEGLIASWFSLFDSSTILATVASSNCALIPRRFSAWRESFILCSSYPLECPSPCTNSKTSAAAL